MNKNNSFALFCFGKAELLTLLVQYVSDMNFHCRIHKVNYIKATAIAAWIFFGDSALWYRREKLIIFGTEIVK